MKEEGALTVKYEVYEKLQTEVSHVTMFGTSCVLCCGTTQENGLLFSALPLLPQTQPTPWQQGFHALVRNWV